MFLFHYFVNVRDFYPCSEDADPSAVGKYNEKKNISGKGCVAFLDLLLIFVADDSFIYFFIFFCPLMFSKLFIFFFVGLM